MRIMTGRWFKNVMRVQRNVDTSKSIINRICDSLNKIKDILFKNFENIANLQWIANS